MKNADLSAFSSLLMAWNRNFNRRAMPWKGIKDPYKIWMSEIILQQTRVDQGEKYYTDFIASYPTISQLANANEEDVFRKWQGLGYYNRCRNMIATAKFIHTENDAIFPDDYDSILALKGVGEYTAAAISSFAFNLPYAVVDGNVVRVLSRVFSLHASYFDATGKKAIQALAQTLIDKKEPGKYNQAIMDLGATICKPQQPDCSSCPLTLICQARLTDSIALFPIKKERKPLRERPFHFLVFHTTSTIYLTKRSGNDIWKDLHTFYCIEAEKLTQKLLPDFINTRELNKPLVLTQILSHQKITGYFYLIPLQTATSLKSLNLISVKKTAINKIAFPKLILSFFENNQYL